MQGKTDPVFRRVLKIAKSNICFAMSFHLSARPHVKLRSHWAGLMKFEIWVISKICRENSSLIKIRQE
jgi:hypothetical protein